MSEEYLLYKWDTKSMGIKYFVALVEDWERYDRVDREELARGTWEEMTQLKRLTKEN